MSRNFDNISIVDKWVKGYYVVADELEGAFRLSPIPPGGSDHHDDEFVERLMVQVASAKQEAQDAKAEAEEAKTKAAEAQIKIAEAEIKAAESKIKADKLENEVKKLDAQLLEMAAERDDLANQIETCSAERDDAEAERDSLDQQNEELKQQLGHHHHPPAPVFERRKIKAGSHILSGSGIYLKSDFSIRPLRSIVFVGRAGAAMLRWHDGNDITLQPNTVRGLEKRFPGDVLGEFVLTLTKDDEVEVFWSEEVNL